MRIIHAVLAVAFLALTTTPAAAETIDERHATLGWQAENAELIARAELVDDAPGAGRLVRARFEVLEVLAGDADAGDVITVTHPDDGHGAPWREGAEHLVFLRAAGADGYVSVSGTLGVRPLPDTGPERRFTRIVADHLATLDGAGGVRDQERLRELLVTWMGDVDPGVVWSAAVDFHRHRELHADLTIAQRTAVLAAYRRHPLGKASKRALAHALADTRAPGAADALLDTLALPGARALRGDLAAALAALRDDGATARTLARLDGADAALRESLVLTLGVLGDATAVDEVRRRLSDDDAAVRTQAAHALGRIARAVRSREPDARVEGVVQLVALAARARTANEQKAATWALAQLDRPEAYAQLRRLAETDPRDDVRRHARRYLEKPRVSLILR